MNFHKFLAFWYNGGRSSSSSRSRSPGVVGSGLLWIIHPSFLPPPPPHTHTPVSSTLDPIQPVQACFSHLIVPACYICPLGMAQDFLQLALACFTCLTSLACFICLPCLTQGSLQLVPTCFTCPIGLAQDSP